MSFNAAEISQQAVGLFLLSNIHKPMGVSEYQLTQSLPDDLKLSLLGIEEIERELGRSDDE